MKLRWGIVLGLLVVAGCDASVCTDRDSLGNCQFDDFPEFDATTPGIDSSTPPTSDGAVSPDSTVVAPVADAGLDSAVPDAGPVLPATLTIDQFADARYATAKAWRDKLEECCFNASADARADFLTAAFSYTVASTGADSAESFANAIRAFPPANVTFVGTAAAACSTKLAAQFEAPPATCPVGGFDIATLEANIGHQVASPVQVAECRAALVGKVAFNAACTNSIECVAGLRCLGSDGAKTCRDALSASSACGTTQDCADGLVCVTSAGSTSGKACRAATEPLDVTVTCASSSECRKGLYCAANDKCAAPVPELICK